MGCGGTFKHLARGEGVAKDCREVASSDGKVVLKVEGPEFMGNVRFYEAATNKPVGPVMVLSEPEEEQHPQAVRLR